MNKKPASSPQEATVRPSEHYASLATQALAKLLDRPASLPSQPNGAFDDLALARLCDAAMTIDPTAQPRIIDELLAAGITREVICDRYIPAAARRMGDAWCADRMSFAEVSIGAARLQGMLRDVMSPLADNHKNPKSGSRILMIVPDRDDHTLGAMVVTSQLRRVGISVRLCLGLRPETAGSLVAEHDFDLVMISSSKVEGLETVKFMVKTLREEARRSLPIAIGGIVLEDNESVKTLCGADLATNDPVKAVELCNLKGSIRSAS
ncbi:MAG: hypothetical protein HUJ27_14395 [Rhodobacteraceae bacterium]|nr:hypothetical protein [Paracoccaceae bacterium]